MTDAVYDKRWWTLGVLCFSLLVIGLDNTILNVALPTLVKDLHATASQLQWMVDAYVLVFAGLLLTSGSLGDRYGRKLALNAGMWLFAAGSIASAFSGSAGMLILARGTMGIGGALIMPSTLSILTNVFPPRERGQAIGIWAAVSGLGIILGPVIGGYLLDHFWWGSVFLINVPIIAIALVSGWFLIPESKDPEARRLDPVGALLSIAGLSALLYAIIEAPGKGWTSGTTLNFFALAAVLIAIFMWWEIRNDEPMLDLRFFENPRFSAASMSITLVFFAMFGSIFLLTQHLQFVLGYTPLQAGVRLMPVATLIVAAALSSRLVDRFGTKVVVVTGLVIVSIALFLLTTLSITSGYLPVALSIATLGMGMGITMAPATDSIMGSLPLGKAGVGSAMNDTTRQVGGALGVAIVGSIMSSSYSSQMAGVVAGLPAHAAAAARNSVGAATAVAAKAGPAGASLLRAAHVAYINAMGDAVMVAAGVALLGAIVSLLFLPARPAEEQAKVTERERELEVA
ncbi:MAG TPA: MFS transporter [Actinomycetota bacterium]|nr:MFS transporter [Actinomycetota bacterium]